MELVLDSCANTCSSALSLQKPISVVSKPFPSIRRPRWSQKPFPHLMLRNTLRNPFVKPESKWEGPIAAESDSEEELAEELEGLEEEAMTGEDEGREPIDYDRRAQIFGQSSRVFQALKDRDSHHTDHDVDGEARH